MGRRYLLAWDLNGRKVVIVGGGPVGEGKIETLRDSGARLVVVDPVLTPRLAHLAERNVIDWKSRRFRPWDVWRATLVIAATGNSRTNGRIRRWAHLFGAVVNAVDDPPRCDVIIPAVVRRGPATIAVSTNGVIPAGSRFLRHLISDAVPEDLGLLFDQAAIAREDLRASGDYRYDYQEWHQRFFEPGMEAIREGRIGELENLRRRFAQEFAGRIPRTTGKVTLVGAGPGGADLITIRGARALAEADVIFYDRLADPTLLDLAAAVTEKIPVGKEKGAGVDQDEIIQMVIDRAKQGDRVVRLKGGDPFIFGRGTEEVDAITEAGIPVSVIPGLSSAVAGPALAGIALTERGVANSFTVVSGHHAADTDTDWPAVARASDTIVVLMAASNADDIARRLLEAGRAPDQPVAVVYSAGTDQQISTVLTLERLAAKGSPHPSPSILVIGEVAHRAASPPATQVSE